MPEMAIQAAAASTEGLSIHIGRKMSLGPFEKRIETAGRVKEKTRTAGSGQKTPLSAALKEGALREVAQAAASLELTIPEVNPDLKVKIDHDADMLILQIIEGETGDLIRQIPPQEIVKLAARINKVLGAIFDKKG